MRIFKNLFLLLALLSTSLAQVGCSSEAESKEPEEEEIVAIPVEAANLIRGEISAYYEGTASLEAEEEALVASKAGGVVTQLFVEEGQRVKAGQALAKLDGERLALELARSEVSLNKLKREYERNEGLYEKQLISIEEYERVKSEFETQEAAYDLAKLELDYTTVRAPISGVISQRMIKVGNTIRQNDPTFHISDFDPLLAIMFVPERELGKIKVGQQTTLSVDALPGIPFYGQVERISPVVDPATGTFKVTIEVKDESRELKPGMFGRINVVYDTRLDALLAPKDALIEEDSRSSIYIIENNEALRKDVKRGYMNERFVEILEGLEDNMQIITAGQNSLRDSARVEVIMSNLVSVDTTAD